MTTAPAPQSRDPLFTGDAVGGWLQLPSSAVAELVGSVGFDLVCVDTQHGLIGDDTVLGLLQALTATGTPALVRVPGPGAEAIGRALDHGADGVIVPMVDTAEQAAAAVAACRYPPAGTRSFGPVRPSWLGRDPLSAGRCVVMVETVAAVANLEDILAVEGIDAIFVGPSDLALAHGFPLSAQRPGDPRSGEYGDLVRGITQSCAAAGVPVGIYCDSAEHARWFRELGVTYAMLGAEQAFLRRALVDQLGAARP